MAIAQVTAGNRIITTDLNAFYGLLKGVTGEGITLIYNAAGSVIFQPSSDPAAGTQLLQIKNNAGTVKSALTSDGGAVYSALVKAAQGSTIASATTTDLSAATGNYVHISGTTTITGLGTVQAGTEVTMVFDGALTLTYNATSLILQGAANLTTAAGDTITMVSEGSGNWREKARRLASSVATPYVMAAAFGSAFSASATNYTNPGNPNIGATTEATMQIPMARAGTLANFYVQTQTTQNAGGSLVFTIRKNTADTTVIATVTAGAVAGTFSDTTHSVAFVAGDLLTIKVVNNYGGGASAVLAGYSFTYA